MPKYQNISDFRQSMVFKGNRILLRPGDVINSDSELREIFLEKVEEDTAVTFINGGYTRQVDKLAEKVTELEKEKETLAASNNINVENNLNTIQASINDLKNDLSEDLNQTREMVKALKEMYQGQKEFAQKTRDEFEKEKDVIGRRLALLKSAMMTMEEEIYGPMEDSEGNE